MKVVQVDGTTCSKSGNKQEQGKEVQITEDWGIRESRETRALKLEGTEIRDGTGCYTRRLWTMDQRPD